VKRRKTRRKNLSGVIVDPNGVLLEGVNRHQTEDGNTETGAVEPRIATPKIASSRTDQDDDSEVVPQIS
jgi:hypothetical protein